VHRTCSRRHLGDDARPGFTRTYDPNRRTGCAKQWPGRTSTAAPCARRPIWRSPPPIRAPDARINDLASRRPLFGAPDASRADERQADGSVAAGAGSEAGRRRPIRPSGGPRGGCPGGGDGASRGSPSRTS
jgi:hypothetical protein